MDEPLDVSAFRAIVGDLHVLTEPDVRAGYETDWTGRYTGECAAVVRPGSTAEVAAVLALCNREQIVVIPQAGNSGLVGGGVPRSRQADRPSIILAMRRLDTLGPVDRASMQVTAGAGVTLAAWRAHARAAGFDTPVDFAARELATIGGAIATNAGGSRVLRFGTMRQQTIGIEAVLASGEIVGSLAGLPKETSGLHWPSIIVGSEGTLAVVTAARLRLVPHFTHAATALVVLASIADAGELLTALRRVPSLDAVEFIESGAMDLVSAHLARTPPLTAPSHGCYVMIDCAGDVDPTEQLADAIGSVASILDAAVTNDDRQRRHMIEFRDRITDAISSHARSIGIPTFKLDVAVPITSLASIINVAQRAADGDGAELIAFGHLAEGNVHLNFLGATGVAGIADAVLAAVAEKGGTISAEHGIGIAKAGWLPLIRSPGDLDAQRAIRVALDPNGILNPGVLRPGRDPRSQVP